MISVKSALWITLFFVAAISAFLVFGGFVATATCLATAAALATRSVVGQLNAALLALHRVKLRLKIKLFYNKIITGKEWFVKAAVQVVKAVQVPSPAHRGGLGEVSLANRDETSPYPSPLRPPAGFPSLAKRGVRGEFPPLHNQPMILLKNFSQFLF